MCQDATYVDVCFRSQERLSGAQCESSPRDAPQQTIFHHRHCGAHYTLTNVTPVLDCVSLRQRYKEALLVRTRGRFQQEAAAPAPAAAAAAAMIAGNTVHQATTPNTPTHTATAAATATIITMITILELTLKPPKRNLMRLVRPNFFAFIPH